MSEKDNVRGPTFDETVDFTKSSYVNLMFTLRDYFIQSGFSEEDASLEVVKQTYQTINEFSKQTISKTIPKPKEDWLSDYDNLLKEIKGKRQYYPVYQKLLRLRKKLKA